MAMSGGFEGFEKRLELHFFGDDPVAVSSSSYGLRLLPLDLLEEVLDEVQCTVVSAVGNPHFDSYVLSESSLFIYPTKIIIKTCGTTQLLKSVRPLLIHARNYLGLSLTGCRYTRGTFIFPEAQPFPHTSFHDEVAYLEQTLPPNTLRFRKASIMPSSNVGAHAWHVFTASCNNHDLTPDHLFTVEVCMTELDQPQASKFFQKPGGKNNIIAEVAGREMTAITGIGEINPAAHICDFAFDPCGYSMNGLDGERYSTIHVTPEEGFSYASYECVFDDRDDIIRVLRKVAHVFRPGTMSVSITCSAGTTTHSWARVVGTALEALGYKCRSCVADEFPEAGAVIFQTFRMSRRK